MRDERLYWRGPVIWARVVGPKGTIERRSTGCTDERAASERADFFERCARDPAHAAVSTSTLADALKLYLADLVRRRRSEATKKIAVQKAGHFVRLWGDDFMLSKIAAPLIQDYIDRRQRERVVDYTIKRELTHLRQALRIARHAGVMQGDVDSLFPPYFQGTSNPRTRWPTPEEIARLEKTLRSDRFAHVLFILSTGARLGESQRARRSHVDFEAMTVELLGSKTRAAKGSIPITAISEPMLRRSLELAPGRDVLFSPWGSGNIIRDLRRACEDAKIERLSANDLRRAFAQWHRRAGVDNSLTSKLLRHTTDKLVQTVYANLDASGVGPLVAKQLDFYRVPSVYAPTVGSVDNSGQREAKTPVIPYAQYDSNVRHAASKGGVPQVLSGQEITRASSTNDRARVPSVYAPNSGTRIAKAAPFPLAVATGVLMGLAARRGIEVTS